MPVETKPRLTPATKPEEQPTQMAEPDRLELTTAEEQREYDEMLEKDFLKIDPKTKRPVDTENYYRIIHTYPEYQTANPAEFKAVFVVDQYVFAMNPDGTKRRQKVNCHNIKAKLFKENFMPTITESIAKLEAK